MKWKLLRPVFAAGLVMLGGCAHTGPNRDFNELIPRLLGAILGNSPEEAARNLFNETSPDERRDAIAYLELQSYGHEPAYMQAYELLATDPYPMVRAQAMRALGSSGQPAAVPYLVKGLSDTDVQVRRDAACGLIATWDKSAEAPLAELVKSDPDDQVRVFCARALINARDPDAYWALIGAMKDRDAAVVRFAYSSLVEATGEDFSYDYKRWLDWYDGKYMNAGAGSGAGGAVGIEAPTGIAPATRP